MSNKKEVTALNNILKSLLIKKVPFAVFSLPGNTDINIFISKRQKVQTFTTIKNLNNKTGLIFTPFIENDKQRKYFLEPDIIINGLNGIDLNEISDIPTPSTITILQDFNSTLKSEFISNVNSIKQEIRLGRLKKTVLSRLKEIKKKEEDTNLANIFQSLNSKYINAFCYFTHLPGCGTWLGASPEPLLEGSGTSYSTVALAGTKYLNGTPVEDVEWSVKEIDEQAMVANYIKDQLDKLDFNSIEINGPYNQKAAKLVHLKTDFNFNCNNKKQSTDAIINALHPTPSISGYPSLESLELIKSLEKHNRSYYAGLIGPVNYKGSTHIFVNLRCMQVTPKNLVLYAGAGITAGSDPEKEWNETEQKLDTLRAVISTNETN